MCISGRFKQWVTSCACAPIDRYLLSASTVIFIFILFTLFILYWCSSPFCKLSRRWVLTVFPASFLQFEVCSCSFFSHLFVSLIFSPINTFCLYYCLYQPASSTSHIKFQVSVPSNILCPIYICGGGNTLINMTSSVYFLSVMTPIILANIST